MSLCCTEDFTSILCGIKWAPLYEPCLALPINIWCVWFKNKYHAVIPVMLNPYSSYCQLPVVSLTEKIPPKQGTPQNKQNKKRCTSLVSVRFNFSAGVGMSAQVHFAQKVLSTQYCDKLGVRDRNKCGVQFPYLFSKSWQEMTCRITWFEVLHTIRHQ